MTDALNFHPSQSDYNFKLKANENSDDGNIQTADGVHIALWIKSVKRTTCHKFTTINYEENSKNSKL